MADLPRAWRESIGRLPGVEVPNDAEGALQDVHWGAGSFGYFPSYALGVLIAAQLWEALTAESASSMRRSLAARSPRSSGGWASACTATAGALTRRARQATGAPLGIEPFLRYVAPLAGH